MSYPLQEEDTIVVVPENNTLYQHILDELQRLDELYKNLMQLRDILLKQSYLEKDNVQREVI